MKPTLNEQLARMQKLAGIIKENQVNEARTYYHVLEDGGYGNIGHQGVYDTKEEAQNEADRLSDMFPKSSFYIESSNSEKEPVNVTMENQDYYKDAEKDDAVHIDALEKDMKDDAKKTSEGKMTKSDLKAKIKEMILAELTEDSLNENSPKIGDKIDVFNPKGKYGPEFTGPDQYLYNAEVIKVEGNKVTVKDLNDDEFIIDSADIASDSLNEDDDVDINNPGDLNNMYDPLAEAKKDEEVEDVTVDDTEVVDAPASDMMAGESAEVSGIQANLQAAYAEAKALGDEKLITQIANTITYFTKAHILDTAPVNENMFPMLKRIIK